LSSSKIRKAGELISQGPYAGKIRNYAYLSFKKKSVTYQGNWEIRFYMKKEYVRAHYISNKLFMQTLKWSLGQYRHFACSTVLQILIRIRWGVTGQKLASVEIHDLHIKKHTSQSKSTNTCTCKSIQIRIWTESNMWTYPRIHEIIQGHQNSQVRPIIMRLPWDAI